MAVFLPTAFLGGITGQLYRQFALTIAATAVISAINAVTLKPAQCAVYLRPSSTKKNWFYRGFNYIYGGFEAAYTSIVRVAVRQTAIVMLLFLGLVALTGWWFVRLPTGFVPTEDQGYAIIAIQLPDAASQERTRGVTRQVNAILKETPGIRSWFLLGGMSLLDSSVTSNAATMFITFTPFEERSDRPELSQEAILGSLMGRFQSVREALVLAFPPPGIRGLGVAGGFEMKIEDRGGVVAKDSEAWGAFNAERVSGSCCCLCRSS
jgi:HAE1 family hydrophobic/amphiphilic exporter-1